MAAFPVPSTPQVGDFYVIDYRHDPRGEPVAPRLPPAAVRLWDHFAAIGEAATATWGGLAPRLVPVLCRRRPGRRPCGSYLHVVPEDDAMIHWACPRCDDGGALAGWKGLDVDLSRVPVPGCASLDPADWFEALLPADEYRILADPRRGFSRIVRRIVRAARPTRPGIQLEAPEDAWEELVVAVAEAGTRAPRAAVARGLGRTRVRLLEAARPGG